MHGGRKEVLHIYIQNPQIRKPDIKCLFRLVSSGSVAAVSFICSLHHALPTTELLLQSVDITAYMLTNPPYTQPLYLFTTNAYFSQK